jgi:hypothetical protein
VKDGRERTFQSPPIQSVASTLGVRLDKFVPFSCLHRGSINSLHVILVKLGLRFIRVPSPLDDTSSPPLFLKIIVDTHRGEAVARLEHALTELGALIYEGEWLERLSAGIQQRPSSLSETCHCGGSVKTLGVAVRSSWFPLIWACRPDEVSLLHLRKDF